jgi:hypothetical protein
MKISVRQQRRFHRPQKQAWPASFFSIAAVATSTRIACPLGLKATFSINKVPFELKNYDSTLWFDTIFLKTLFKTLNHDSNKKVQLERNLPRSIILMPNPFETA